MSRGPGIWQRQILDRIHDGKVVILTGPEQSHSDQNAIRRAAYTLEAKGDLKIISHVIDGRPRLVAVPVTMPTKPASPVIGLDGKTYRRP